MAKKLNKKLREELVVILSELLQQHISNYNRFIAEAKAASNAAAKSASEIKRIRDVLDATPGVS
jgi:hypothetical protein